jgi:hypothetical protein
LECKATSNKYFHEKVINSSLILASNCELYIINNCYVVIRRTFPITYLTFGVFVIKKKIIAFYFQMFAQKKKLIIDRTFGPIYFERRTRTAAHIYDAIAICPYHHLCYGYLMAISMAR